jgi:carbon monoxide dehydrogenase subunit G
MITAEAELQINRPLEEVFDFWADVRNENDWNPGSQGWEKTSPGPVGLGTTFTGEVKGMGAMTMQNTEYQRPFRVIHRGSAKSFDFASTLIFEPSASGTRVRATGQVEPRGLFKLMAPLMGVMMKKQFTATMINLKCALEERASQPAPDSTSESA